MPESVSLIDIELDALELRGDARSAWAAIEVCTAEGRPLPGWVLGYLSGVARKLRTVRRQDNPFSLWEAIGLYDERNRAIYDADNDPEFIYARIQKMKADREVKNVAEGARLYVERYLPRQADPESVRKRYYEGRRITARMPVPDGTEPEAQAVRCIINMRTGHRRIETR